MKNIFEPSGLLTKISLIDSGLTENELKNPLIGVFYESDCLDSAVNVREGILLNNCACVLIPIPSVNDYMSINKNLFFIRDSICSLSEGLISLYSLDAMVIVCQNEMTLAGVSLASVRKNVPFCVFAPYLHSGFNHKEVLCSLSKVRSGKNSISEINESSINISRSNQMDNVNSLLLFFEGLGIAPADSLFAESKSVRINLARKAGELICKMANDLIYPKKLFTLEAFNSALQLYIKEGGTISCLTHIEDLAKENSLNLDLERIGFDFVKGNIAKKALCKKKGSDKALKGKVFVYDDEDSALNAIYCGAINEGNIIALRAFNVLVDIESALNAMGLENVAIITDSRIIELNLYPLVYVVEKSEAFEVIQNGDIIDIDFKKGKVNLDISNKEIGVRQKRIR